MEAASQLHARFCARLDDHIRAAERGTVAVSAFLTPAERRVAKDRLAVLGLAEQGCFWGGYPTAERVCLFLLPEFYAIPAFLPVAVAPSDPALLPVGFDPDFDSYDADPAQTIPDPAAASVAAVLVTGSGYRELSHRDYLGSILGLGLERDAVGDIVPTSPSSAVVFCAARLIPFLTESLTKVASDTARVAPYAPPTDFIPHRAFADLTDTVASPRLDCVVASLANLSRDAAQSMIRSGLVEVDFLPELRPDHPVTPPATLSLRSVGRFRVLPFAGTTKKGRLKLQAKKYL